MFRTLKVNKSFLIGLKLLVFCLVFYIFYWQTKDVSLSELKNIKGTHIYYLLLVVLLMPLNWYLDFLKWKMILRFKGIGAKNIRFKSFISGIAISAITPNRIGNFLGRMVWFSNKNKVYVSLATLYSNFAQFLSTLIVGVFGLSMANNLPSSLTFNVAVYASFITILGVLFLCYLFSYAFIHLILKSKPNISNAIIPFLKQKRLRLLLVSVLRFVVICNQYYFTLCFFQIESFYDVLPLVMTVFLFTTLTPSLFFGKLMVRESIALFILTPFYSNEILILTSSLLLWFINLGIPALIGGLVLARLKLK